RIASKRGNRDQLRTVQGTVVGRIMKLHGAPVRYAVDVDAGLWSKPTTEVKATSILPSLNGKTARSWRGIVAFTHLAREGRMTVTIGRRELLVALGGAAVAWPLAARAQQEKMPVIGFLNSLSPNNLAQLTLESFLQGLKEAGFVDGQNV